jgi:hypothetical protein
VLEAARLAEITMTPKEDTYTFPTGQEVDESVYFSNREGGTSVCAYSLQTLGPGEIVQEEDVVDEDDWIRGRGHDGGVYTKGKYFKDSIAAGTLGPLIFKTKYGYMESKFVVQSNVPLPPGASLLPSFTRLIFETKNVPDGDVETTRTTSYEPPVNTSYC